MAKDITTLSSPAPDGKIHPDCKLFHETTGQCICLMVACVGCGKRHAPHKPCPRARPCRTCLDRGLLDNGRDIACPACGKGAP
jgi:hypothetical protein